MESIDIRDFTTVTALDSDNLLLSRADGTAAKVSLAALKTALGEVFAAKAALTAEATHRADVDSALRTDLDGVTRSVEDLVAANEQTQASFAEVRATNTAQDAALASEVTRATTAEAAILATALGTGAENAYDVPMKVEKVTGVQMNVRLNELILSRRGQQTNGLYRFEHAQGHQALLLMGGNVINDTPTTANAATQILIGNIGVSTGEQYIDEDAGFTNGASFSATKSAILMRRINYTGNGTEYTVTQWTNKLSL